MTTLVGNQFGLGWKVAAALAAWLAFGAAYSQEAQAPASAAPTTEPTDPESAPSVEAGGEAEPEAADGKPKRSLDEVLANTLGEHAYGEPDRCIPRHRIRQVKALDEQHISFKVGSRDYYLVQLRRPCPGLDPKRPVVYESRSSSLCQLDTIRTMYAFGGSRLGPACTLQRFQPISEEQLDFVRESIEQERRARKKR